mgnify:FL=1
MDESEIPLGLGNALLFAAALFGAIASFSRPVRDPYGPREERAWEPWNLPVPAFLFLLWLVVMVILFSSFAGRILGGLVPGGAEDVRVLSVASTFVMQVGLVAVVVSAIRRRGWDLRAFFRPGDVPWKSAALHTGHLFLRYLPLVWLVGVFWGGLLLLLEETGVPVAAEPQQAAVWIAESRSVAFVVAMGLMVVLAAPVSEELVFRAFLYRFLAERISARLALVASGVLFALLHASLQSFLPLCFLGLLLVKLYRDSGDIRTPILFHLYFNAYSFLNLLLLPT